METLSSILMAAAVIAVIILLLKIIAAPMKLAFKLLLNALSASSFSSCSISLAILSASRSA